MKQLQFYKYASLALLLLNIAIIAFFFFSRPLRHHGPNAGKEVIEILALDEDQHRLFLASANTHEEKIDDIRSKQRRLLLPYFQSITSADTTISQAQILDQVETLERTKITATYQHFAEIKTIIGTGKDKEFEIFIENIINRVLKTQESPPHKHKNN